MRCRKILPTFYLCRLQNVKYTVLNQSILNSLRLYQTYKKLNETLLTGLVEKTVQSKLVKAKLNPEGWQQGETSAVNSTHPLLIVAEVCESPLHWRSVCVIVGMCNDLEDLLRVLDVRCLDCRLLWMTEYVILLSYIFCYVWLLMSVWQYLTVYHKV